jgi:hypothetical protein
MSYRLKSWIDRQMMIVTNINEFVAVQLMYFLYTSFRLCEMKDLTLSELQANAPQRKLISVPAHEPPKNANIP